MATLSNQLSTWRKLVIECKAGIVTTVDFKDTRPNIMFIMNPTESVLLASIDSTPTEKQYDFKIKEHYTRLIGKPTRTSQCYIYNTSKTDCTVQVYSLYDANFDPSWIKDFNIENVNISEETLKQFSEMISGKVTIEGVEKGVTIPVKDSDNSAYWLNLMPMLSRIFAKGTNDPTYTQLSEVIKTINDNTNVIITSINQYSDSKWSTLMSGSYSSSTKNLASLDSSLNDIKRELTQLKSGTAGSISNNDLNLATFASFWNNLLSTSTPSNMTNLKTIYNAIHSVQDKIESLTAKITEEKTACFVVFNKDSDAVADNTKNHYITMLQNSGTIDVEFRFIDNNNPAKIIVKAGETLNVNINAGHYFDMYSTNESATLNVAYEC